MPYGYPAPWTVPPYIGAGWDVVDANGVNVAQYIQEEECARLIAEAPNMYNLLNQAFHVLCEHNLEETLRLDIDAALCHVENYPVPGEDDDDFNNDFSSAITFEEAMTKIPVHALFRHFKGSLYEVLAIAKDTETEQPVVIYQDIEKRGNVWARPASMWFEEVADGVKRFECVDRKKSGHE